MREINSPLDKDFSHLIDERPSIPRVQSCILTLFDWHRKRMALSARFGRKKLRMPKVILMQKVSRSPVIASEGQIILKGEVFSLTLVLYGRWRLSRKSGHMTAVIN